MQGLAKREDLHLKRKLWHIVTGLLALAITFFFKFDSKDAALASFFIGLSGLLFEIVRLKNSKVNQLFINFASGVLRERERTKISGFTFYCFGVSLSFFLLPWEFAITSVLFLIFGDPVAAMVGSLYGRHKLIRGKSLEGSLACFGVCAVISAILATVGFLPLPWAGVALLGGLSGAIAELMDFIDDNLAIPLISGFLLSRLSLLLF